MTASSETVSVVIPLYNRREEIGRSLASVLNQSRAVDEIVVVDDASSDGSAEAVAALGEARIRLLRHDRNQGAAAARNTGIAAAMGDWIALLDSDDEWARAKLAVQLAALARSGDAAGITGYTVCDYRNREERLFTPSTADARLDALVWGCPLGFGATLLARRQIFAEIGMLDPALRRLEDWEWLMRYLPAHRLHVVPQPLTLVHKKSNPSRAQVFAAVAHIRAKYRAVWYRRSWLAGRKFNSTLLIEQAAAAHYEGDNVRAGALVLSALAAYPFRPRLLPQFARRILRFR